MHEYLTIMGGDMSTSSRSSLPFGLMIPKRLASL